MSRGFWEFKALRAVLANLRRDGRKVPCWESVDYLCGECPALVPCRAYAVTVRLEDGIHD